MFCGWQFRSTKNLLASDFEQRKAIAIASAHAVASSSNDAFATSKPVKSQTSVWKISRTSSLPWLISDWYGV